MLPVVEPDGRRTGRQAVILFGAPTLWSADSDARQHHWLDGFLIAPVPRLECFGFSAWFMILARRLVGSRALLRIHHVPANSLWAAMILNHFSAS